MKTIRNAQALLGYVRNGEHFEFHWSVTRLVDEHITELPLLSPLWLPYKQAIDREDVIYKQSRGMPETKEVEAADRRRDESFLAVKRTVEFYTFSAEEDKRAAALRLKQVIDVYKNASSQPYIENTALITNLTQDFQAPPVWAAIEKLGIEVAIEKLSLDNTEFENIYNARALNRHYQKELGTMAEIRPITDKAYGEVVDALNTLYKSNELLGSGADEGKRVMLSAIIDGVNSLINQWEVVYSRRTPSYKSGNKPGGGGNPSDPDEPGEPGDETEPDEYPHYRVSGQRIRNSTVMEVFLDDPNTFVHRIGADILGYSVMIKPRRGSEKADAFKCPGFVLEKDGIRPVGFMLTPPEGKKYLLPFRGEITGKVFILKPGNVVIAVLDNVKYPGMRES